MSSSKCTSESSSKPGSRSPSNSSPSSPPPQKESAPPKRSLFQGGYQRFCSSLVLLSFLFQTLWPSVAWAEALIRETESLHGGVRRHSLSFGVYVDHKLKDDTEDDLSRRPASSVRIDFDQGLGNLQKEIQNSLDIQALYPGLQATEKGLCWSTSGVSFVMSYQGSLWVYGSGSIEEQNKNTLLRIFNPHGTILFGPNLHLGHVQARAKDVSVRGSSVIPHLEIWAEGGPILTNPDERTTEKGTFSIPEAVSLTTKLLTIHKGETDLKGTVSLVKDGVLDAKGNELKKTGTLLVEEGVTIRNVATFQNDGSIQGKSLTLEEPVLTNGGSVTLDHLATLGGAFYNNSSVSLKTWQQGRGKFVNALSASFEVQRESRFDQSASLQNKGSLSLLGNSGGVIDLFVNKGHLKMGSVSSLWVKDFISAGTFDVKGPMTWAGTTLKTAKTHFKGKTTLTVDQIETTESFRSESDLSVIGNWIHKGGQAALANLFFRGHSFTNREGATVTIKGPADIELDLFDNEGSLDCEGTLQGKIKALLNKKTLTIKGDSLFTGESILSSGTLTALGIFDWLGETLDNTRTGKMALFDNRVRATQVINRGLLLWTHNAFRTWHFLNMGWAERTKDFEVEMPSTWKAPEDQSTTFKKGMIENRGTVKLTPQNHTPLMTLTGKEFDHWLNTGKMQLVGAPLQAQTLKNQGDLLIDGDLTGHVDAFENTQTAVVNGGVNLTGQSFTSTGTLTLGNRAALKVYHLITGGRFTAQSEFTLEDGRWLNLEGSDTDIAKLLFKGSSLENDGTFLIRELIGCSALNPISYLRNGHAKSSKDKGRIPLFRILKGGASFKKTENNGQLVLDNGQYGFEELINPGGLEVDTLAAEGAWPFRLQGTIHAQLFTTASFKGRTIINSGKTTFDRTLLKETDSLHNEYGAVLTLLGYDTATLNLLQNNGVVSLQEKATLNVQSLKGSGTIESPQGALRALMLDAGQTPQSSPTCPTVTIKTGNADLVTLKAKDDLVLELRPSMSLAHFLFCYGSKWLTGKTLRLYGYSFTPKSHTSYPGAAFIKVHDYQNDDSHLIFRSLEMESHLFRHGKSNAIMAFLETKPDEKKDSLDTSLKITVTGSNLDSRYGQIFGNGNTTVTSTHHDVLIGDRVIKRQSVSNFRDYEGANFSYPYHESNGAFVGSNHQLTINAPNGGIQNIFAVLTSLREMTLRSKGGLRNLSGTIWSESPIFINGSLSRNVMMPASNNPVWAYCKSHHVRYYHDIVQYQQSPPAIIQSLENIVLDTSMVNIGSKILAAGDITNSSYGKDTEKFIINRDQTRNVHWVNSDTGGESAHVNGYDPHGYQDIGQVIAGKAARLGVSFYEQSGYLSGYTVELTMDEALFQHLGQGLEPARPSVVSIESLVQAILSSRGFFREKEDGSVGPVVSMRKAKPVINHSELPVAHQKTLGLPINVIFRVEPSLEMYFFMEMMSQTMGRLHYQGLSLPDIYKSWLENGQKAAQQGALMNLEAIGFDRPCLFYVLETMRDAKTFEDRKKAFLTLFVPPSLQNAPESGKTEGVKVKMKGNAAFFFGATVEVRPEDEEPEPSAFLKHTLKEKQKAANRQEAPDSEEEGLSVEGPSSFAEAFRMAQHQAHTLYHKQVGYEGVYGHFLQDEDGQYYSHVAIKGDREGCFNALGVTRGSFLETVRAYVDACEHLLSTFGSPSGITQRTQHQAQKLLSLSGALLKAATTQDQDALKGYNLKSLRERFLHTALGLDITQTEAIEALFESLIQQKALLAPDWGIVLEKATTLHTQIEDLTHEVKTLLAYQEFVGAYGAEIGKRLGQDEDLEALDDYLKRLGVLDAGDHKQKPVRSDMFAPASDQKADPRSQLSKKLLAFKADPEIRKIVSQEIIQMIETPVSGLDLEGTSPGSLSFVEQVKAFQETMRPVYKRLMDEVKAYNLVHPGIWRTAHEILDLDPKRKDPLVEKVDKALEAYEKILSELRDWASLKDTYQFFIATYVANPAYGLLQRPLEERVKRSQKGVLDALAQLYQWDESNPYPTEADFYPFAEKEEKAHSDSYKKFLRYVQYRVDFASADADHKKEILTDFYGTEAETLDPSILMPVGDRFGVRAKVFKKAGDEGRLHLEAQTPDADTDNGVFCRLIFKVNANHYDALHPFIGAGSLHPNRKGHTVRFAPEHQEAEIENRETLAAWALEAEQLSTGDFWGKDKPLDLQFNEMTTAPIMETKTSHEGDTHITQESLAKRTTFKSAGGINITLARGGHFCGTHFSAKNNLVSLTSTQGDLTLKNVLCEASNARVISHNGHIHQKAQVFNRHTSVSRSGRTGGQGEYGYQTNESRHTQTAEGNIWALSGGRHRDAYGVEIPALWLQAGQGKSITSQYAQTYAPNGLIFRSAPGGSIVDTTIAVTDRHESYHRTEGKGFANTWNEYSTHTRHLGGYTIGNTEVVDCHSLFETGLDRVIQGLFHQRAQEVCRSAAVNDLSAYSTMTSQKEGADIYSDSGSASHRHTTTAHYSTPTLFRVGHYSEEKPDASLPGTATWRGLIHIDNGASTLRLDQHFEAIEETKTETSTLSVEGSSSFTPNQYSRPKFGSHPLEALKGFNQTSGYANEALNLIMTLKSGNPYLIALEIAGKFTNFSSTETEHSITQRDRREAAAVVNWGRTHFDAVGKISGTFAGMTADSPTGRVKLFDVKAPVYERTGEARSSTTTTSANPCKMSYGQSHSWSAQTSFDRGSQHSFVNIVGRPDVRIDEYHGYGIGLNTLATGGDQDFSQLTHKFLINGRMRDVSYLQRVEASSGVPVITRPTGSRVSVGEMHVIAPTYEKGYSVQSGHSSWNMNVLPSCTAGNQGPGWMTFLSSGSGGFGGENKEGYHFGISPISISALGAPIEVDHLYTKGRVTVGTGIHAHTHRHEDVPEQHREERGYDIAGRVLEVATEGFSAYNTVQSFNGHWEHWTYSGVTQEDKRDLVNRLVTLMQEEPQAEVLDRQPSSTKPSKASKAGDSEKGPGDNRPRRGRTQTRDTDDMRLAQSTVPINGPEANAAQAFSAYMDDVDAARSRQQKHLPTPSDREEGDQTRRGRTRTRAEDDLRSAQSTLAALNQAAYAPESDRDFIERASAGARPQRPLSPTTRNNKANLDKAQTNYDSATGFIESYRTHEVLQEAKATYFERISQRQSDQRVEAVVGAIKENPGKAATYVFATGLTVAAAVVTAPLTAAALGAGASGLFSLGANDFDLSTPHAQKDLGLSVLMGGCAGLKPLYSMGAGIGIAGYGYQAGSPSEMIGGTLLIAPGLFAGGRSLAQKVFSRVAVTETLFIKGAANSNFRNPLSHALPVEASLRTHIANPANQNMVRLFDVRATGTNGSSFITRMSTEGRGVPQTGFSGIGHTEGFSSSSAGSRAVPSSSGSGAPSQTPFIKRIDKQQAHTERMQQFAQNTQTPKGKVIRADAIPAGSKLEYLGPGKVKFDGVEFRAVRDLGHLTEGDLLIMQKRGYAPKGPDGKSMHGHHYKQLSHRHSDGFVVEMPGSKHDYANKIQHPKPIGEGLPVAARKEWNQTLRAQYWMERARTELLRRGVIE